MIILNLEHENISFSVEPDTLLLDALRSRGYSIDTPCGGQGICKKCALSITDDASGEKRTVLSCTHHLTQDTTVHSVLARGEQRLAITADEARSVDIEHDPFVRIESNGSDGSCSILYGEKVLEVLPAQPDDLLGLAIDVGTTGVSLVLFDLINGKRRGADSFLNPQTEAGADVLSRISYCSGDPTKLQHLQDLLLNRINKSLTELCGPDKMNSVYHVMVSANTIMSQIFLGVAPDPFKETPYAPPTAGQQKTIATALGINFIAVTDVIPWISNYIGGDIASGLVSSGFLWDTDDSLFIDIGTNGEIVLLKGGKLYAASTAAGPAFEGANISCGMRATEGAIVAASRSDDGSLEFKTVKDAEPKGLAGSGLLDTIAALLNSRTIAADGELVAEGEQPRSFSLTSKVHISQNDIRNVQLAKAAIAAGIKTLLDSCDAKYGDLASLSIAGAFGHNLTVDSLKTVGLISPAFDGEVHAVGNSSLIGARMALLNRNAYARMTALAGEIRVIDLAADEGFQKRFIEELSF